MDKDEVIALLAEHRNERGVENWHKVDETGLDSFGIGLSVLRKLAKKVGRDHELSAALWDTPIYDAKVLALLVDEPKRMTREQAEVQVEQLEAGMLTHVFSSCDATLAKTAFVRELADEWMKSDDEVRVQCGYGLLYEMSKDKRKSAPPDEYFQEWVDWIAQSWAEQDTQTVLAMAGALLGIGKRSLALNTTSLALAKSIGPVRFDDTCDPFDVVKHLENEGLQKKLRAAK